MLVGLVIRYVGVSCTHVECVFLHVTWLARVAESVVVCIYLGGLSLLAEGETESQWLQDTGLSDLLGGLGLDSHHRGLLSTLTQTQVAAVRRRLDICARSARRRYKAPVRDVRDIFGGFDSGVSQQRQGDCRPVRWAHSHPEGSWSCCQAALASACSHCAPCCREGCPLRVPLCVCLLPPRVLAWA